MSWALAHEAPRIIFDKKMSNGATTQFRKQATPEQTDNMVNLRSWRYIQQVRRNAPKRIETHRESSNRDRSREKWETILQMVQKPRAKGECLWQQRRKIVGTLNTGQKSCRQESLGRDSEQMLKNIAKMKPWTRLQAKVLKNHWKTLVERGPGAKTIEKRKWNEAPRMKSWYSVR